MNFPKDAAELKALVTEVRGCPTSDYEVTWYCCKMDARDRTESWDSDDWAAFFEDPSPTTPESYCQR